MIDDDDLAVAPDGSPVLLYLAIPGEDEAALVHRAIPERAAVLELGCGAGRVTRHLVALGHAVTGVDNSPEMLAHLDGIVGAEPVLADIASLDLAPRTWPVVLAASHLVNDGRGAAFLGAAARHVAPDGVLLVQRHEPGWVDTVETSTRTIGEVTATIRVSERKGPGVVTATMAYELRGHRFDQAFTAYDVDDDCLSSMASAVGLVVDAPLDDRGIWVRLRRR